MKTARESSSEQFGDVVKAKETQNNENGNAGIKSVAEDDSAEIRADVAAEVADTAEKLDGA